MRHLLVILALCLLNNLAFGQIILNPNPGTFGVRDNRRVVDSTLYFPTGCGVPVGIAGLRTAHGQIVKMAAQYRDTCGHVTYVWDPSSGVWDTVGKGSGGGGNFDSAYINLQQTDPNGAGGVQRFRLNDSLNRLLSRSSAASQTVKHDTLPSGSEIDNVDTLFMETKGAAKKSRDSVQGNLTAGLALKADKATTITINGVAHDLSANSSYTVAGGTGTAVVSDLPGLEETKIYSPAKGVAASQSSTNYNFASVDSMKYKFSTTGAAAFGTPTEYGGWLAPSTSGDSIRVTAPFWVTIGDSQAEGHPGKHGRLHPYPGVAGFTWNYPDSVGQLSYHLRALTHMRWYNQGIGGQTTIDIRTRFLRDAIGLISNAGDTRGNQTLTGRPQGVVIIAGINDIYNVGISLDVTKENLRWMAAVCQEYGVKAVFLNMPGEAASDGPHLKLIDQLNLWFASGALNQYGAVVVDYNSWWQNPSYKDNFHPSALIADDIHPTLVGYDSLAHYIFRQAKLPVLSKVAFTNDLDPGGFTGYSRPAGITINANAYTIAAAYDTVAITTYVPDTVWIKVTSSTNVSGTAKSGFSHIEWFTDNNANNDVLVTKKTPYKGNNTNLNLSNLVIQAPDYFTRPALTVQNPDGSIGAQFNAGGQNGILLNGATVFGSTINATSNSHQFGLLEILRGSTRAGNTGMGITATALDGDMMLQSKTVSIRDWANDGANFAHGDFDVFRIYKGWIGPNNDGKTATIINVSPTYNMTDNSHSTNITRGYWYHPTITAIPTLANGMRHIGFESTTGDHLLASVSGSVGIGGGAARTIAASAIFDVSSTTQGALFPRMNTAQQNAIASPAAGLLIYNTDSSKYRYYDGSAWVSLSAGGGGGGGTPGVEATIVHDNTFSADRTFAMGSHAFGISSTNSVPFLVGGSLAAPNASVMFNSDATGYSAFELWNDAMDPNVSKTISALGGSSNGGTWAGQSAVNMSVFASYGSSNNGAIYGSFNNKPVYLMTNNTERLSITNAGAFKFTLGSDATGDIFYRNSSGNFVRLPVGTAAQTLHGGTIPVWKDTTAAGAGGSPALTSTYIGVGDGSNLLSGSSNFTFATNIVGNDFNSGGGWYAFRNVGGTTYYGGLFMNSATGEMRIYTGPSYFPTLYSNGSKVMSFNSSGVMNLDNMAGTGTRMLVANSSGDISTQEIPSPVLYTATADGTVGNTVTPTSIIGTGVGTVTIPANFLTAGSTIKFKSFGTFTNDAGNSLYFNTTIGGSNTGLITSNSIAGGQSGVSYEVEYTILVKGTGTTAAINVQAKLLYSSASNTFTSLSAVYTASTTVNTTISNAIDFLGRFNAASNGSNIITSNYSQIKIEK